LAGLNYSSHSASFLRWRKPALVTAAVGLLAFVIWTLPNWGEFWSTLLQFPSLWQIPANRRIILYLTVKIMSPLFIMGIMGVSLWMYYQVSPFQDNAEREHIDCERAQHEVLTKDVTYRRATPSMPGQQSKAHAPYAAPSLTQPVLTSRIPDPETPLPSTLSLSEALKSHERDQASNEPQALFPDQHEKSDSTGGTFTVSLPSSKVPQPVVLEKKPSATSEPLISIRLLKEVSMTINIPGGGHVVVPLTLNAKRVQLLAYIAWRRGELIDRDKILEHVFGWGLSDEEATEDKLSERFESHKKLLRRKVREVVTEQVNKPAGRQLIDPDLDPFVSDSGFWGLADICRVEDLEAIEADYQVIALARKNGKTVDEIPEYVKEACERLIANYPGDFLESLLKKYPGEFRPWQGHSSWVRKPYTHYRDYYLDALWYAAEYDWRMGQRYTDVGEMDEEKLRKQQECFGRAAQKYQSYAMYACNSKFDAKATFGAHGQVGERIGMSERALRRCIVLLGAIGRTDLVNQVWSAYYTQMKSISDHRWQPSKETLDDVQAAKAQTSAYRFAAQISQMSSEFGDRQDRVS
jgi:hypothetical protein